MTQPLTCRDGSPLSPMTFGTMQFGGNAGGAESRALFDAAREAGINHFDTAVGYNDGESERLLGGFVAPERDGIYVATKVAFHGGATRDNIRAQFDECRRNLRLDAVDLLYLHRWDPETPLEESFETLAELQQQGLIRHIGASNFAAWQVMKAQAVAARLGTRIDVIQPMYSLVKRQAEVELFPMATDQGIAVHAYSPLGGGLLTGKYTRGGTGRLTENEMYRRRYDADWIHNTASDLAALAAGMGTDPATLAVAWVMAQEAHPAPIVSARSVEQLRPSLAALEMPMPPELYQRLSALSPAPPPATDRLEEL